MPPNDSEPRAIAMPLPPDPGDKSLFVSYVHFMVAQLNDTIRYSDSKHTLGMTLVVSLLLASNEFLFARLDTAVYEVQLMLNINVASALLAIAFGYLGIFPKFISPSFSWRKRNQRLPNIFYFKEINECDINRLREAIQAAFPKAALSERYKDDAVAEIYALSKIVSRKFTTFRLFLYALFFFLVTLGWLFVTTLLDLSTRHS